jgi:hypothetical protein
VHASFSFALGKFDAFVVYFMVDLAFEKHLLYEKLEVLFHGKAIFWCISMI